MSSDRLFWPAVALAAVGLSGCRDESAPGKVPVIDVISARGMPIAADPPQDPSVEREGKMERPAEAILRLPCGDERTLRSLVSEGSLEIDFTNAGTQPIAMYWIDFQGLRVHYADVAPGASYTQQTYVTHPWVAVGANGKCVGIIVPRREDTHEVVVFGRSH